MRRAGFRLQVNGSPGWSAVWGLGGGAAGISQKGLEIIRKSFLL